MQLLSVTSLVPFPCKWWMTRVHTCSEIWSHVCCPPSSFLQRWRPSDAEGQFLAVTRAPLQEPGWVPDAERAKRADCPGFCITLWSEEEMGQQRRQITCPSLSHIAPGIAAPMQHLKWFCYFIADTLCILSGAFFLRHPRSAKKQGCLVLVLLLPPSSTARRSPSLDVTLAGSCHPHFLPLSLFVHRSCPSLVNRDSHIRPLHNSKKALEPHIQFCYTQESHLNVPIDIVQSYY